MAASESVAAPPVDPLAERVKEQYCVTAIARAMSSPGANLREVMAVAACELKRAMLDPGDAAVEIIIDAESEATEGFVARGPRLSGASGPVRIDVVYRHPRAGPAHDPFLAEEKQLVDTVSRLLHLFASRSEAVGERDSATLGLRRLAAIQDSSPAIAFVWRLSGGWPVEYVSPNVRQLGYTAEDFLDGRMEYGTLVHPDDRARVADEVDRFVKDGRDAFQQTYRIVNARGDVRWIDDHTRVLRDGAGHAGQAQGIIIDITERVLAENRARRYLHMAGYMLVVLDRDGRVTMVNERTSAVTGRSQAELLGIDWIATFVPAQDRAAVRAEFDAFVANPGPERVGEYEHEIETGDGERRRIHWRHSAQTEPGGGFDALVAFGADVTEQTYQRARMEAFASIPRENPNPVLRVDANGDVILANNAAQALLDRLSGDGKANDISREQARAWRALMARAAGLATAATVEMDIGSRHFLFNLHPVKGQGHTNIYGIDDTERNAARIRVERLAEQRVLILHCQKLILEATDERTMLGEVARAICRFRNFSAASVRTVEGGRFDGSPVMWCARTGQDRICVECGQPRVADTQPSLALPVRYQGRTVLVTEIFCRDPDQFDEDTVTMLGAIQDSMALGVNTLRSHEEQLAGLARLKAAALGTVDAIASTVEARDPYTAGHQKHVAQLVVAAARELGWTEDRIEGLRLGAMIHDIGKIALPMEILNRPGKLSAAQMAIVQEHPGIGAEIMDHVAFQWPIRQMILQHHERMDGSGYPRGLRGDEICPEARLIAVADVLEAMSSHRPYRPALGIEEARKQVLAERGTRLDADMVDACLAVLDHDDHGGLLDS